MNKHLPQVLPRGNHHIIVLAFFPKFIVVKWFVFLVGMGRGFVISLLNQFNESSNAGEVVLLLTIATVRMSF